MSEEEAKDAKITSEDFTISSACIVSPVASLEQTLSLPFCHSFAKLLTLACLFLTLQDFRKTSSREIFRGLFFLLFSSRLSHHRVSSCQTALTMVQLKS